MLLKLILPIIGYRSIGKDPPVSTRRSSWWTEYHLGLQGGLRDPVHVHDRKEQKKCPLLRQIYRVLPNTVHSEGKPDTIWASSWDYGTYHIGDQRRLRRACASAPSLFAHMEYGSRQRVRPKIRQLAPLGGCARVFEEWVYGVRKVP